MKQLGTNLGLVFVVTLTFCCAIPVYAEDIRTSIILSANVSAYSDAIAGFKDSGSFKVLQTHDMRGDASRGETIMARIEKRERPDVILAVGPWALKAALDYESKIPVVYTMVMNPLMFTAGKPGVTGAGMNVSVAITFDVLKRVKPNLKSIGVMYSQRATSDIVNKARVIAQKAGIDLRAKQVASSKDVLESLREFGSRPVEFIWILPDPVVVSPAMFKRISLFSIRSRTPLLGSSEKQAKTGATIALSFSSADDIGKQAGELAKQWIGKGDAVPLPTEARATKLTINLNVADRHGLPLSKDVLAEADTVID